MNKSYTARYSLREVLGALGMAGIDDDGDVALKTLSTVMTQDLKEFVRGIDGAAKVTASSDGIKVLLSQESQQADGAARVYRYLKSRESRYEQLINHSDKILGWVRKDALNARLGRHEAKLYLRIGSLSQIKRMGRIEFDRLLDDIVENMKYNPDYATGTPPSGKAKWEN